MDKWAANIIITTGAWADKVADTIIMAAITEAVVTTDIREDTKTGRIFKVEPEEPDISSRHHHRKCGYRNNKISKIQRHLPSSQWEERWTSLS